MHTHTCTRALKMRDKVKRMPLPTIAATAECATLHTREVQDPKPFTMTCAVCRRSRCISAAAEAQEHYTMLNNKSTILCVVMHVTLSYLRMVKEERCCVARDTRSWAN